MLADVTAHLKSVRIDFFKAGMGIMTAIQSGRATLAFDGTLDLGLWKQPIHLEQQLNP